jgi:type II secretory pathway pseudopilin PulG
MKRNQFNNEEGFTLVEVAMATIITAVGLVFLAMLFVVAIGQNRGVKQFTATTKLAQQKLEELQSISRDDCRLVVGGGLTEQTKQTVNIDACKAGEPAIPYFDVVYVDDATGTITTILPEGATPTYHRYWKVEPDPGGLLNSFIVSCRVVSDQPGYGRASEETTLTTSRTW